MKTVGTFTRSSKFVSKEMVSHVDFKNARTIVELGAGDGAITKHILANMRPDSKLLAFEVHPNFCETLRNIKDDRLIVVEASAEDLGMHLQKNNLPNADFIISAIPFVALPDDLAYKIVEESRDNLVTGGKYIQIHYSLLVRKMYRKVFGNVDVNFVTLNIPPAFVLVSEKR